ncbi:Pyruvate carboxyl transferase subunit B [Thioalkalivibrio nitratireducens DSM 14787]|uniref:Pyruvate carboxyl transferase subunit B n=1 Tax=Thioalkalivibrio nitratireducens (strain DSM 14787 / UNIQEM 213 / ALEN2) TaxID=1255043 RepID=L0DXF4_THIND|nr:sodium-extruding oxaloacetate decarboxylase subunit alpha [Thioalkalivibrio nitratireducens]AGA33041.1 Pyruvate carboxyl transferase subunit B [Thioalkalivibrio nitratireducens DSM 14787]
MSRVHITDVTLRDGHQSLIATRLRTEDMLPICAQLDRIGFHSLEAWGGATFDACIRFLKEDPWERLHRLKAALPNTPLQMLLRGQNLLGYRHYADDVVRSFVQRSAAGGIAIFRIFDAMNDIRNLRVAIEATREADAHAQGTICYTTSPVHTPRQFVAMAREMVEMGAQSVAIKDMAGLLTPSATHELVTDLVDAVDVPIHLHAHATSGLSELCHWQAIEAGCRHIETAISAFAGGTSHPPTESMVAALAGTRFDTGLDLAALQEIGAYFREVRKKYARFESGYTGVDTRVQTNQVPGGMISNLANQLRDQDALDQFDAVLVEIPKVREALGYPPLVTPTSQIVGTQAVMNILAGERYKVITNEVKHYLMGHYGRTPGPVNPIIRGKAIGNAEVVECRPADRIAPEMDQLRADVAELAVNEEDVLTYALFPEIGRQFLEQRAEGTLVPEPLNPPQATTAEGCPAPVEFNVTFHGETYHIKVTGSGHRREDSRPLYVTVDGLPEEVLLETLDEIDLAPATVSRSDTGKRARKGHPRRATRPGDVTTSMPGTVIDVLVSEGQQVTAGDPVLVLEAMKMESEIPAPVTGVVKAVNVTKGQAANPDDALIEIEA